MIPEAVYFPVMFGCIFMMSVVLHEFAHGYIAYLCGDQTAYLQGRLTLNPLKHIDPFMTIMLPLMLWLMKMPIFGGAKPVPVNPYMLRNRKRDGRLVALAGVAVNFLIALTFALLLRLLFHLEVLTFQSVQARVLGAGVLLNLILMGFNLLPIPPLDGSRVLRSFLPSEISLAFDRADRYGIMILFAIIYLVPQVFIAVQIVVLYIWHYVLFLDVKFLDDLLEYLFSK